MSDAILLTFNAGSSSLKLGLFFRRDGQACALGRGQIDFGNGSHVLRFTIGDQQHEADIKGDHETEFPSLIAQTLDHLTSHISGDLVAAAHRVVHGGLEFQAPVLLDAGTIERIEGLVPLAPLHQPQALKAIHALSELRPQLAQTASFDTAFHTTQADLVRRLAIPRHLHNEGVRRYGFHGLSYTYIAGKLHKIAPDIAGGKVVTAHLGSGASLCAMSARKSIDTSMGFSALDGIPMAARPGWIDPGALIHLMRNGLADPDRLERFLYHDCGLLGVSGISGDTRDLLESKAPEAAEAIDLFCLRIAGETGRLAATLGGMDAFVFTGGVGENQSQIRARVAGRLAWLGAELDATLNKRNETVISTPSSRIKLLVVPTDEEQVLADDAMATLA